MSDKRWFGTDGIRGRVGSGPISADFVLKLGWAVGRVLGRDDAATVVIGKDTRISGYMFESALEAGLVAAGVDVRLLGPMPTPAVAWLTRSLRASAGIVISASHNPHHDNGIKFFSAKGEKLSDAVELAIEAELEQPFSTVASEELGKAARVPDAPARYVEFCKSTVPPDFSLRGLKLVLDCAHGANYQVAPRLFAELGAEVHAIGVEPDGLNINAGCGSTDLAALRAAVTETGAALGIAFDGDGDRVLMIDGEGDTVDGDELLFLLALDRLRSGQHPGTVVGTLMSNVGLERALAEQGIGFVRARVGDRYVHQQLLAHGGVLGGEASGHLLVLDRASTGDGIVSALQVLRALQNQSIDLRQRRQWLKMAPQRTLNLPVAPGSKPLQHPRVVAEAAAVESRLGSGGRLVLRASGTEPLIRITIECDDAELLQHSLDTLGDAVRAASADAAAGSDSNSTPGASARTSN